MDGSKDLQGFRGQLEPGERHLRADPQGDLACSQEEEDHEHHLGILGPSVPILVNKTKINKDTQLLMFIAEKKKEQ